MITFKNPFPVFQFLDAEVFTPEYIDRDDETIRMNKHRYSFYKNSSSSECSFDRFFYYWYFCFYHWWSLLWIKESTKHLNINVITN